ncbi:hypothetical protein PINS_up011555 [Pythium insidiosum]|nr:hypothetical protein PINS_up011555 [Pythium insidiosum]
MAMDELAALAAAYTCLYSARDDWMRHVSWDWRSERSSCGAHCLLISHLSCDLELAALRLGELLRLLRAAAPLGPVAYRAVLKDSNPACPRVRCAWHEDADNTATMLLMLHSDDDSELQVLHDALLEWDEDGASDEFKALHVALQQTRRSALPPPLSTATRATTFGVDVKLHPTCRDAAAMERYTRHLERLLAAWTTEPLATRFCLLSVELHESDLDVQRHDFVSLLRTTLRYPVPQSVVARYSRWMTVSTLVSACSDGSTPAFLTGLDLCLDSAALSDLSTMSEFCELLTTQCGRLQWLSLDAAQFDDDEEQHRQSVQMVGTALVGARCLEALRVIAPVSVDPFMRSVLVGVESTRSGAQASGSMPTLWALKVKASWSANALLSFISKCPKLCELKVQEATSEGDESRVDPYAGVDVASLLPALTKLTIKTERHPTLLPLLIERSRGRLTHLRFTLPFDADGAGVAETIVRHCPSLAILNVGDPDSAFVNTVLRACDDGRVRRLRQLSVYHDARPTDPADSTLTLACLCVLRVLSDPRHRLTQTLQTLKMAVPPQDCAVVKRAMNLMLRCNSTIMSCAIKLYGFWQHLPAAERWDDDDSDSIACDAVRQTLSELTTLAGSKVAIPVDGVLPDVVVPPSLRRRLALVSVVAARGVQMPEAVLRKILTMAGRRTRRHTPTAL